jgi:hypothetical protein
MDHCGNIEMLREDIPIVASTESIAIMKGMQDAGISPLETDTAYFLHDNRQMIWVFICHR